MCDEYCINLVNGESDDFNAPNQVMVVSSSENTTTEGSRKPGYNGTNEYRSIRRRAVKMHWRWWKRAKAHAQWRDPLHCMQVIGALLISQSKVNHIEVKYKWLRDVDWQEDPKFKIPSARGRGEGIAFGSECVCLYVYSHNSKNIDPLYLKCLHKIRSS